MQARLLLHDSQGEGDPVVLVPGGLTGWLSWLDCQALLADRYRVIRVQPIHNELGSAGIKGDPEYSTLIERESLRLTLDELALSGVHLIGWSGGGRAALEFVCGYPDRIRSLTLVEPAAYWVLNRTGDRADDLEDLNSFIDGLYGEDITEEDLARFLEKAGFVAKAADAPTHPAWERWLPHRMALSWQGGRLGRSDLHLDELGRIHVPVLLTRGTTTSDWLKRVVDELALRIPEARVSEFVGDHAHHLQNPSDFAREVERHLATAGN